MQETKIGHICERTVIMQTKNSVAYQVITKHLHIVRNYSLLLLLLYTI